MMSTLEVLEHNSIAPATHAIIWLHGLGADGHDFVPMVDTLRAHLPAANNVRFIFPHAPMRHITINPGYKMRGWYDIFSLDRLSEIDEAGIQASIDQINQLIQVQTATGIPPERILLAGFSQGAVIAMRIALQCVLPLAGVIALSGYLPLRKPVVSPTVHCPIFLAHGTEDAIVPYLLGEQAHVALQRSGFDVAWHTYPIGHTVSEAEAKDIAKWLEPLLLPLLANK